MLNAKGESRLNSLLAETSARFILSRYDFSAVNFFAIILVAFRFLFSKFEKFETVSFSVALCFVLSGASG